MTDENNVELVTVVAGSDPELKETSAGKHRAQTRQETPVKLVQAASAAVTASRARNYSAEERLVQLALITTQVAEGTTTLKDAVKAAGISEQTYYNWKRTANRVEKADNNSIPAGDELADLVQLDQENLRLRKLLGDKLRAENAQLRERLGLG